jgi:hypothetical protein
MTHMIATVSLHLSAFKTEPGIKHSKYLHRNPAGMKNTLKKYNYIPIKKKKGIDYDALQ